MLRLAGELGLVASVMETPTLFPDVVFPAPEAVPPVVFDDAPVIRTPLWELPRPVPPSIAVPMGLPSTIVPAERDPLRTIPGLLDEIVFPATAEVPPIVLLGAFSTRMPVAWLPRATEP